MIDPKQGPLFHSERGADLAKPSAPARATAETKDAGNLLSAPRQPFDFVGS